MMGGVSSSRNASNANANAIKKMPMPATPLPVAGKKKVASNAPLPATAPVAPAAKSSGVSARSTAGAAAVAAVAAVAARPAAPALQSQVQTQIQMQEPFPSITIDEPLAVSAVSSQTRSCIEQLHIERASLQHNFGNLTKQTLTQQKKLVEAAFGQQLQQLDDHYAAEEQASRRYGTFRFTHPFSQALWTYEFCFVCIHVSYTFRTRFVRRKCKHDGSKN